MSREWKNVKEELDNLDKTYNFSIQKNYKELLNNFKNMDEVLDNMKLAVKLKPRMQSLIKRQKDILEQVIFLIRKIKNYVIIGIIHYITYDIFIDKMTSKKH